MTLSELQKRILALAEEKGWGTKPNDVNFGEKIALIHAEASEALEAYRKNNMDGQHGVAEELGDIILRTLHLAGIYDIHLEQTFEEKMERIMGRDWSNDKLNLDRKK